jgi:hypothetical protein
MPEVNRRRESSSICVSDVGNSECVVDSLKGGILITGVT